MLHDDAQNREGVFICLLDFYIISIKIFIYINLFV
jgi:hypothetical protein